MVVGARGGSGSNAVEVHRASLSPCASARHVQSMRRQIALGLSESGAESQGRSAAAAASQGGGEAENGGGPAATADAEGVSAAFDCSTSQVQGLTDLDGSLSSKDLKLLESESFRNTMQRVVWGMARYMLFTGCAARKDLKEAKLQEVVVSLLGQASSNRKLRIAAKRIAIAQAQRILSHVFGLGLDKVPRPAVVNASGGSAPAQTKKAQVPLMVINTLYSPLVRRAIMQRHGPPRSALLMLTLAVIKLEGDAVEKAVLWQRLSALGTPSVVTESGQSHGPFDDLHQTLKEFTDARYVAQHNVHGASANEPRRTVLTMGPRAVAEIGHPAVIEFILQVMDPAQRSAAFQGGQEGDEGEGAAASGHVVEHWRRKTDKWRQEALTRQQAELDRENVLHRPSAVPSQPAGSQWTTQRSSSGAAAATQRSASASGTAVLPDGDSVAGSRASSPTTRRRTRQYGKGEGEDGDEEDSGPTGRAKRRKR